MKKTNPREFKQLGKTSKQIYDNPDPALLECFPSPFSGKANVNGVVGTIHIEAPEFTTLCPITGQPDFATIVIDYEPDKLCVESKSLKLYLGAFRQFPEFHEASVSRIANDLISLLKPRYIRWKVALRLVAVFLSGLLPNGGRKTRSLLFDLLPRTAPEQSYAEH